MGKGTWAVIFSIEAPLHVSSVQVVDPVTGYVYDRVKCTRDPLTCEKVSVESINL